MDPHTAVRLLEQSGDAPDDVILSILADPAATLPLRAAANRVRLAHKGPRVKRRALIEITNDCLNNCFYCGIRAANRAVRRYCLSPEQIIAAAENAYARGYRTFVLQGGENPALTDTMVTHVLTELKSRMPDAAVTLSLGERRRQVYEIWREAGAERYLLRHETYDASHYRSLHPRGMSRQNRLRCLGYLAELGYRVGTGFLVGSPGQTPGNILRDLRFIASFKPGMIGIGPFVPAAGTPFADRPPGDVGLTLRCVSVLRLMNPDADIPATTALGTLGGRGVTLKALLGGANVIMPKFTPDSCRELYKLY